jgi:hypothetical protein
VSTNFGKQYAEEEEIEDIKGVIRIRKSKKIDNTMAKRKRPNNDLYIINRPNRK